MYCMRKIKWASGEGHIYLVKPVLRRSPVQTNKQTNYTFQFVKFWVVVAIWMKIYEDFEASVNNRGSDINKALCRRQ